MEPAADLILANRAYVDHQHPPGESEPPAPASGGLLAALRAVIRPWDGQSGTTWIGAGLGGCDRQFTDERGFELVTTPRGPLRHRRLFFDASTWSGHYVSVANSFLWPLLHLVDQPLPDLAAYYPAPDGPSNAAWAAYQQVNQAFARAAAEEDAATCWVHDYQLALVPALAREAGFRGRIGFFLHTPFPRLSVAAQYLDQSARGRFAEFVRGILGADLVGFQVQDDLDRFREAAVELCGALPVSGGVAFEGRMVELGAHPVGVDVQELLDTAEVAPSPAAVVRARARGLPVVVGLERSDFTKGIPERLEAVALAFQRGCRFAYVGIAAPTRAGVPAYDRLGEVISAAAAAAQEAAEDAGGLLYHSSVSIDWPEVVALQRESDVVFTSSLADGMNLVPLQAAVAQSLRPPGERAVLLAGRQAGVARAYEGFATHGLVPVDPLDVDGMAAALADALEGRPGRVSDQFIDEVRRNDARAWAGRFLQELEKCAC